MSVDPRPLLRPAYDVYRRATAGLRRLPDFIVIGAQKAGTTSFFANVLQHPLVDAPRGKEAHFFSRRWEDGELSYRSYFPFDVGAGITGEASPDYIVYPEVPGRVKELVPRVKVIALLREPVSRAYSHYQMTRRRGHEDLSFVEAIEAEEARLRNRRKWGGDFAWRNFSYATRGRYAEQLRPWVELFGRRQLRVIRSEDFYSDPEACVASVATDFLGLPSFRQAAYQKANTRRWKYDKLSDADRRVVATRFEEDNDALATLLGRPAPFW